ncbi:hypothetical protein BRADI_4g35445v3 [Brachypodium distachyon]|uniref:Uncharacterized protein n=1 Tax=Brachypodium distachyon TaxID=15368 RepID=A0A2K2CSJ1_BRADI|nr:hypothetical protein BRADI_4g35445v3 [Brachypodium distachyon]
MPGTFFTRSILQGIGRSSQAVQAHILHCGRSLPEYSNGPAILKLSLELHAICTNVTNMLVKGTGRCNRLKTLLECVIGVSFSLASIWRHFSFGLSFRPLVLCRLSPFSCRPAYGVFGMQEFHRNNPIHDYKTRPLFGHMQHENRNCGIRFMFTCDDTIHKQEQNSYREKLSMTSVCCWSMQIQSSIKHVISCCSAVYTGSLT